MAAAEKPVLARYRDRMDKCISTLKEEFSTLRTGRASSGLLDQVIVEAYGAKVPITQVGSVSVPEPRSLTVSIWDKGLVVSVEKAIRNSGLGLNPVVEGQNLRIPIPPLTEERRKDLTKVVRHAGEEARIATRNLRRDANEHLKKLLKDKEVSEDDERRAQEQIQRLTDGSIAEIDRLVSSKEAEILAV